MLHRPPLPSTCPRLFVHLLPDGYRSTSDVDANVGRGIGQPVKSPDEGFRIYDGQHYQLGEHFYQRALNYRCRTLDPADADLFFVPAFSHVSNGWTNVKKRMVADNMSTASRDDALFTRLRSVRSRSGESVLEARGGADHVLLSTRDGLPQDGAPFWELDYADSRLGAATRLAISEFRSVWHAEWPSSSVGRAAADQYQSVPYNAVVHADTHMRLVPWQHQPARRRDNPLVAYTAGSRRIGEAALLRAALKRSCINGRPWCDTRAPEAQGAGLGEQDFSGISALYYAATYCLQPIGDTISRKGMVDALLLGCIPVLFHPGQLQQWGWFWGAWVTNATVLFNMTEVISGAVDVVQQLRGIAPARVAAMPPGELKTDVGSLLHRSFTRAGWDERGAPQTWPWHEAKTFKTIPVPELNQSVVRSTRARGALGGTDNAVY